MSQSGIFKSLVLCLSLLLLSADLRSVHCIGFQYVTCGSVLKLVNTESNTRLHSHEVKYGSGSGQQSVTGMRSLDDVNSYWVVRGAHGERCQRGSPVQCGSVIRLQHLQTRLFLHSHNFRSPLSNNQEVSCFGGENDGDEGDNWRVVCNQDNWNRDGSVRLQHIHTNGYLHVSGQKYGRPIAGQYEISVVNTKSNGNLWKAMEGVYMEPDNKNKL